MISSTVDGTRGMGDLLSFAAADDFCGTAGAVLQRAGPWRARTVWRYEGSESHSAWQRPPREVGVDVVERLVAHLDSGLHGGGAHVRQQEHVVEFEVAGVMPGLALVDVETGIAHLAGAQRRDQV